MDENLSGKNRGNKKHLILVSTIVILVVIIAIGVIYFQKNDWHLSYKSTNKPLTTQSAAPEAVSPPVKESSSPAVSQKVGDTAKVIVYNTHPFEKYKSGEKITDISRNFAEKLSKAGVSSVFLDNSHQEIKESYKFSRELVLNNVTDSNGKVLLDILTGENTPNSKLDLTLWIGKGNKNFSKNEEFANSIMKEVKVSDKSVSLEIFKNDWVWNQDLSDKAVTIIIGNKNTPKEKIEKDLNILSAALKNIDK